MPRRIVLGCCALLIFAAGHTGRVRAQDRATTTGARVLEVGELAAAFPGLQKTIAVRFEGKPLEQALRDVAAKADLALTYSDVVLPKRRTVWLTADRIRADEALEKILADAGLQLVPLSSGRLVVVPAPQGKASAAGAIVGRVTDGKTGLALAGATVVVQGTSHSATTGNDGRYRIADVAPGTYTVRARYIGYAPATASVTVSADQQATADLVLEKSAQRLDEVVTTGTIAETEVKALPSPITVITGDEIRESHVQRVDQLFRGEVPGAFSFDEGSGDDVSRIFVRGGSELSGSGGVKTYIDGVEMTDGSSGLFTIDPSIIDRIELVRGPQASTIYGSEALNGVLQIFTKRGSSTRHPTLDGRLSAGVIQSQWVNQSWAPQYHGALTVSGGGDAFSYSFGANRTYKGAWVASYFDGENSAYGDVRIKQGWLDVDLSGRLGYDHRGSPETPLLQRYVSAIPALAGPPLTDVNYPTGGFVLTLRAQRGPRWQHSFTIGADRSLQEFVSTAPHFVTPDDSLFNVFSADATKLTALYTTTLNGSVSDHVTANLTGGVNFTTSHSNVFSASAVRNNGSLAGGTIDFATRLVQSNWGYFLQGQLGVSDALFVTAGLRAESNPNFGQDFGLSWAPRGGVSYVHALGANVTIKTRASYGKSIRPPSTAARLGFTTQFERVVPNPNIGPETQQGFDGGIELYFGNRASLQATYYDQTAGDLIDQVLVTPGAVPAFQNQNIGKIKNRGVELQGSVLPARPLTLSGTFTISNSKVEQLSPSYTGDMQLGDQLLSIPKYTAGASLTYSAGGWGASAGMTYIGSWTQIDWRSFYDALFLGVGVPYSGSTRPYWTAYPAFTKFRFSVSRRLGQSMTAFANAENVGNSYAVEETNLIPTPGRMTTVGLDFHF